MQDNTFKVRNPADMLKKLKFEYDQLEAANGSDLLIQSYLAMNCCMTAWHIKDWVKESFESVQWAACTTHYNRAIDKSTVDAFILENRWIALCRQVATASKHMVINTRYNCDVKTEVFEYGQDQSGQVYTGILIQENDKTRVGVALVIGGANKFWTEFLTASS